MIPSLLILALIAVESGGDDLAYGNHGELGCLQISAGAMADCNRVQDLVKFSDADRLNRIQSERMLEIYLMHYASPARLGHTASWCEMALIWHYGPNGFHAGEDDPYWAKIKAAIDAYTLSGGSPSPFKGTSSACD